MKRDEKEEEFVEEDNAEGSVDESLEHGFKQASEIQHVDDSQLPQSAIDFFKK